MILRGRPLFSRMTELQQGSGPSGMTGTGAKLVRCRHFVEQVLEQTCKQDEMDLGLSVGSLAAALLLVDCGGLFAYKPKSSGSGLLVEAKMREAGHH